MQLLEVITVGLPFCVFKLLTGLWLVGGSAPAKAVGGFLLLLGALDLLINLANLVSLALLRRRVLDACTLALATRPFRPPTSPAWTWQDLGNSLDVLVAMSIVAYMIWANASATFSDAQRSLWNACVILDVMGAGLTRFSVSLRRLSATA